MVDGIFYPLCTKLCFFFLTSEEWPDQHFFSERINLQNWFQPRGYKCISLT